MDYQGPAFNTPQEDIDRCLAVENSVAEADMPLYMECMNGVKLAERVRNPRPCDRPGRDVRDGCILVGMYQGILRRRSGDYS